MNAVRPATTESELPVAPWPRVKLGEMCEVLDSLRRPITKKDRKSGSIPYYGATGVVDYVDDFIFDEPLLLLGEDGAKWGAFEPSSFLIEGKAWVNNHAHVLRLKPELDRHFAMHYLNMADLSEYITGVTVPKLNQARMCEIALPLPPLSVQRSIVARLDAELARADRMREQFLHLAESASARFRAILAETFEQGESGDTGNTWPRVKLGSVFETGAGGTPSTLHSEYYEGGSIPWLQSGEVNSPKIVNTQRFITPLGLENSSAKVFPKNTVVVAMYGATAGQVGILRIAAATNQAVCGVFPDNKYLPEFLYYQLCSQKNCMVSQAVGGAQPNISQEKVRNLSIIIPPLPVQRSIVTRLDAARAECDRIGELARKGAEGCAALRAALLKEAFE